MNATVYASETDERIGVTQHMRASGEVMAHAMWDSVQKIDVGLIFATMLQARGVEAAPEPPASDDHMPAIKSLAVFGAWCARVFRDSLTDLDGGAAQDAMVRSGVIVRRLVNEACGVDCVCATVTDFPTDCYVFEPGIQRVMGDLDAMLAKTEGGAG